MSSRIRSVFGLAFLCISAILLVVGCGSHSRHLAAVRSSLLSGNIEHALAEFEDTDGDPNDLLYLLEKGYMLHLAGRWTESNDAFEAAEQRADELYSKSLTRQAAALLTSDLALPYRGLPYEIQLVQYYRALNYLQLDLRDDALVEARKANYLLDQLIAKSEEEDEDQAAIRQNAFMHYFTGLLYESVGDVNDAIVSFRDAYQAYGTHAEEYGSGAPSWVDADYFAAARHLGLGQELGTLESRDSSVRERARMGDADNLVIFFESGFVPFREEADITLPILDDSDTADPWQRAMLYSDAYGPEVYSYHYGAVEIDHVLRFAFPYLVDAPRAFGYCELILPDGTTIRGEPALDLGAVAHAEFQDQIPGMLLKTLARAFAKETARKTAKKENEVLGWVVNAINLASERADTRGWVLLPRRIDVIKTHLPEGTHEVTARFRDYAGVIMNEWVLTVESTRYETQFTSLRSFY